MRSNRLAVLTVTVSDDSMISDLIVADRLGLEENIAVHRHMYDRLFIQGDLLNILLDASWIENRLRICGCVASSVSDCMRKRMEDVARIA